MRTSQHVVTDWLRAEQAVQGGGHDIGKHKLQRNNKTPDQLDGGVCWRIPRPDDRRDRISPDRLSQMSLPRSVKGRIAR